MAENGRARPKVTVSSMSMDEQRDAFGRSVRARAHKRTAVLTLEDLEKAQPYQKAQRVVEAVDDDSVQSERRPSAAPLDAEESSHHALKRRLSHPAPLVVRSNSAPKPQPALPDTTADDVLVPSSQAPAQPLDVPWLTEKSSPVVEQKVEQRKQAGPVVKMRVPVRTGLAKGVKRSVMEVLKMLGEGSQVSSSLFKTTVFLC
jgi:hypothetical protein